MARRTDGVEVLLGSAHDQLTLRTIMNSVFIRVRAGTFGVLATILTNVDAGAQQPIFTPDHANGIYKAGERIGWTVTLPKGANYSGPYAYTIRRFGADSIGAGTLSLA